MNDQQISTLAKFALWPARMFFTSSIIGKFIWFIAFMLTPVSVVMWFLVVRHMYSNPPTLMVSGILNTFVLSCAYGVVLGSSMKLYKDLEGAR